MILSEDYSNFFTIRNRRDLSIIKDVFHNYGVINSGLCYPDQKIVVLGINNNLVYFNYESMKITFSFSTYNTVSHMVKVTEDIILIGEIKGNIELINKNCFTRLWHL